MLIAWVAPAAAADLWTCSDTTPVEPCFDTIQGAIDASLPGDAVFITEGEWSEALTIDHDLTLRGIAEHVLRDPVGVDSVITVTGGRVTLRELTVMTNAARAVSSTDADLVVEYGMFESAALQYHGGILEVEGGSLTVRVTSLRSGTAHTGGLIYANGASVVIESAHLSGGRALTDGGCLAVTGELADSVSIEMTTFEGCTAVSAGGGMSFGSVTASLGAGVVVTDCLAADGGGISSAGASFHADGITVYDNVATNSGGGMAALGQEPVVLERSVLRDNRADLFGGGLHSASPVSLHNDVFVGNTAGESGGAAFVGAVVRVSGSRFCSNVAGHDGAALAIGTTDGSPVVNNNVFGHNVADTRVPGAPGGAISVALGSPPDALAVRFNTFVGNTGVGASVLDLSQVDDVPVDFTNNLVANNVSVADPAVDLDQAWPVRTASSGHVMRYNLWWENDSDPIEPSSGIFADPDLAAWTEAGCALPPVATTDRDSTWPTWYGAGRDAGDPALLDANLLSRADIGAHGGPEADPTWYNDFDKDGYAAIYDCDSANPTIHPEADDEPYDGVDANCDAWSDDDADHDGWDFDEECDDSDPTFAPDAVDVPRDGLDQDCVGGDHNDVDADGWLYPDDCDDDDPAVNPGQVDRGADIDYDCDGQIAPLAPRGCASAPGGALAGWAILGLALLRTPRRR